MSLLLLYDLLRWIDVNYLRLKLITKDTFMEIVNNIVKNVHHCSLIPHVSQELKLSSWFHRHWNMYRVLGTTVCPSSDIWAEFTAFCIFGSQVPRCSWADLLCVCWAEIRLHKAVQAFSKRSLTTVLKTTSTICLGKAVGHSLWTWQLNMLKYSSSRIKCLPYLLKTKTKILLNNNKTSGLPSGYQVKTKLLILLKQPHWNRFLVRSFKATGLKFRLEKHISYLKSLKSWKMFKAAFMCCFI